MSLVNAPVLGINLKKNANPNSPGYGKYYPEVSRQKTLTTRGFAEHMISHGSKYGLEDIEAILRMFATCLPELLAMGIGVKFDGLGCFLPYAQSKKGIMKAEMAGITPAEIIKAIHIRFLPDSTKLDNLAGPKFADRCSMEIQNVVVVERIKDAQTNKVKEVLRTEIPVNTFLSDNYNGTAGTGSGGSNSGNGGSNSGNGGSNSGNSGSQAATVAAPTISGDTSFADTATVTITAEQGAQIRYTTDGSTPTASSSLYSEQLTLMDTTTVKAIAIKNGQSSAVASKVFTKSSGDGGDNGGDGGDPGDVN